MLSLCRFRCARHSTNSPSGERSGAYSRRVAHRYDHLTGFPPRPRSEPPSRFDEEAARDLIALSGLEEFHVTRMDEVETGQRDLERVGDLPAESHIEFGVFRDPRIGQFADIAQVGIPGDVVSEIDRGAQRCLVA